VGTAQGRLVVGGTSRPEPTHGSRLPLAVAGETSRTSRRLADRGVATHSRQQPTVRAVGNRQPKPGVRNRPAASPGVAASRTTARAQAGHRLGARRRPAMPGVPASRTAARAQANRVGVRSRPAVRPGVAGSPTTARAQAGPRFGVRSRPVRPGGRSSRAVGLGVVARRTTARARAAGSRLGGLSRLMVRLGVGGRLAA
jgi:hypothetical protein